MLGSIVIDHCVIAVSAWERSNAVHRDVLHVRDPDGGLLEFVFYR